MQYTILKNVGLQDNDYAHLRVKQIGLYIKQLMKHLTNISYHTIEKLNVSL